MQGLAVYHAFQHSLQGANHSPPVVHLPIAHHFRWWCKKGFCRKCRTDSFVDMKRIDGFWRVYTVRIVTLGRSYNGNNLSCWVISYVGVVSWIIIPPAGLPILEPLTLDIILFRRSHSLWKRVFPIYDAICRVINNVNTLSMALAGLLSKSRPIS